MPALAGQTMSTINAEREQMDKRRRIDQILDPEFTDDLADIDNAALKARCDLCEDVELELSYERRMLQGKIDLLAYEGRRRTGRETRSLIEALPEILAEHGPSGGTEHGLPDRNAPAVTPDLDHPGRRREDRAISADSWRISSTSTKPSWTAPSLRCGPSSKRSPRGDAACTVRSMQCSPKWRSVSATAVSSAARSTPGA